MVIVIWYSDGNDTTCIGLHEYSVKCIVIGASNVQCTIKGPILAPINI